MSSVLEQSSALTRSEHAKRMEAYGQNGLQRANEIGNRGPVRLDDKGRLDPDILAAYWRHGYYVFQGVVGREEVEELRRDAGRMLDGAPVAPGAKVDAKGRPALGLDAARETYTIIKPLSDPQGGTAVNQGRHPSKMAEPTPDAGAPEYVVLRMRGMCQYMPAGLRVYGHPQLLAIAASINGDDFVPFNDVIFVKQPGVGGSVAWHQDGVTHWDSPQWDEGIHGFNYQVQIYPTTPGNALWVVPGPHKPGRGDIKRMVEEHGGRDPARLRARRRDDRQPPDAARLVCEFIAQSAHLDHVRLSSPQVGARAEGRAQHGGARRDLR